MRKAAIGLLTLGILLSLCGAVSAATHTISWNPVTAYTDGTTISGKSVTYTVYWSTSSSLSSTTTIASGLTATSKTFDPAALGMTAGSTVYFTLKTTLSSGEVSSLAPAKAWVVPTTAPVLSGISISGPSSVNEGTTGAYTATANWSDSTSSSVTPAWTVSGGYASISSAGSLTASAVSANHTVTVTASYTSGGVTKTATKSVTVANLAATLSGISISGPSSVDEGTTGAYAATATWSDSVTSSITPTWSVSGGYASISSAGSLTASAVSANQTVLIIASYTSDGVTKTATKSVTVADVAPSNPASPGDLRIGLLDSSPTPETWRLSWGAVTEYANGKELESGRAVRYNVYWTRDPSLAAGNLVAVATSSTAMHVDFRPPVVGMEENEKIYFTLKAILDSGEQSALSGSLPWRVSSRGPAAPTNGKIEITVPGLQ
jgi:hypothetical protein